MGDRAVLFGPGDQGEPTAQDWADELGTIHYEVVTGVHGRRVLRTGWTSTRRVARRGRGCDRGRHDRRRPGRRSASRVGSPARRPPAPPSASPPAGATATPALDRHTLATQLTTGADEHGGLPAGTPSSVTADDGVRLSCEEIDPPPGVAAELTVVLVHGFALDRRTWHFQRRFLAELVDPAVRQVIYDQRSHGRSERAPRASCTIDQLGHDLAAVLRALASGRPARAGRPLDGRHDDHGAGRAAAGPVRRAGARRRLLVDLGRRGGERGLPGTLLSRRNPLTRRVGLVAGWQPLLVEGARRVGHDLDLGAHPAVRLRRPAHRPWLVDLVDSMISANAVDALTDFVDTLGTHDRVAALPALAGCEVLVAAGDADRVIPFRHSEVIAAELPGPRSCGCPGSGTCRCWSGPR